MNARNTRAAKAARRAVRAYIRARNCGHCTGRFRDGERGWGVYHDRGCPVLAGVVDPGADGRRAAAAASEASGIPVVHGSFARHTEGNILGAVPDQKPGPRAMEIVGWFLGRMKTSPMDICRHIDTDIPMQDGAPVHWTAYDRDRLMCAACFVAAEQRINGTREDATCDYCRLYVPEPGRDDEPRLYALVVDMTPVTVHLGLCPACFEADQAGTAAA